MKNLINNKSSFATALSRLGRVLSLIVVALGFSAAVHAGTYYLDCSSFKTGLVCNFVQNQNSVAQTYSFDSSTGIVTISDFTFGTTDATKLKFKFAWENGGICGVQKISSDEMVSHNCIKVLKTGADNMDISDALSGGYVEITNYGTVVNKPTVRIGKKPTTSGTTATINLQLADWGCATVDAVRVYYSTSGTPTTSSSYWDISTSQNSNANFDVIQSSIQTGTYNIKVAAHNSAGYSEELSDMATFTISDCTQLTKANYTLGDHSFTYNGTEKSVTLTPKDGIPAATIKYAGETTAPTNAGTYALTFDAEASGSYCAASGVSLDESLTISKKDPAVEDFTISGTGSKAYTGSEQSVTVTLNSPYTKAGDVTVYYKESASSTKTTQAPTDAGTYTVTFDVAGGDNFNSASDLTAGTLTITKINQTTAVVVSDLSGTCGAGDYTLSATGGDGTSTTYSFETVSGGTGEGSISGTTLTVTTAGTILVKAKRAGDTNYNESSFGEAKTLTIKAVPTISSSEGGTRCGEGTVTLSAAASAGDVKWYAASTGGDALYTGTSYTTSSISETTSYYAGAADGTCLSANRTEVVATVVTAPTAADAEASDVTYNTATLSATFTAGSDAVSEVGFVYGTSANPEDNETACTGTTGSLSVEISGLNANTQYYYRPYFKSTTCGTTYGTGGEFTTDEKYQVNLTLDGGSSFTHLTMTKESDGVYSCTYDFTAAYSSSNCKFEIIHSSAGEYYGNTGEMLRTNHTNWTFTKGAGVTRTNIDVAGTYKFTYTLSGHKVTLTYPEGIYGAFSGSTWSLHPFTDNAVSINLTESSTAYEFKVYTDNYYSYNGESFTMTRDNNSQTQYTNNNNSKILADETGEYEFNWNTSSHLLTVTYPLKTCTTPTATDLHATNMTQTYTGSLLAPDFDPEDGMGTMTVKYDGTAAEGKTDAGTYAITVDVAKGDKYCAATDLAVGNFVIETADQATLTITNESLTGCAGTAFELTTSGGSGTGAITFAVTAGTGTAEIVNNNQLNFITEGTVTVTATKAGDNNYNAKTSAGVVFTGSAHSFTGDHIYLKNFKPDGWSDNWVCSARPYAYAHLYNTGSDYLDVELTMVEGTPKAVDAVYGAAVTVDKHYSHVVFTRNASQGGAFSGTYEMTGNFVLNCSDSDNIFYGFTSGGTTYSSDEFTPCTATGYAIGGYLNGGDVTTYQDAWALTETGSGTGVYQGEFVFSATESDKEYLWIIDNCTNASTWGVSTSTSDDPLEPGESGTVTKFVTAHKLAVAAEIGTRYRVTFTPSTGTVAWNYASDNAVQIRAIRTKFSFNANDATDFVGLYPRMDETEITIDSIRTYQWQYSSDGTEWTAYTAPATLTGDAGATDNIRVRTAGYYRLIVTQRIDMVETPFTSDACQITSTSGDAKTFCSNIPVINIRTNSDFPTCSLTYASQCLPDMKEKITCDVQIYWNGTDAASGLYYDRKARLNYRGSSSMNFTKKSYAFVGGDANTKADGDGTVKTAKLAMFNLGSTAKDWVLYAAFPDVSMMRNKITYDTYAAMTGLWASHSRYVEVYVDGTYMGVYLFMEKNTQGSDRINVNKKTGYIFKFDKTDTWDRYDTSSPADDDKMCTFMSTYSGRKDISSYNSTFDQMFEIEFPEREDDPANWDNKVEALQKKINDFETALKDKDWETVRSLIDYQTWADWFIINEFTKNVDAYRCSNYFTLNSIDEKIKANPVWDYELGLNNYSQTGSESDPKGVHNDATWLYSNANMHNDDFPIPFWINGVGSTSQKTGTADRTILESDDFGGLLDDPCFVSMVKTRWATHTADDAPLDIDVLNAKVTECDAVLTANGTCSDSPIAREVAKWPLDERDQAGYNEAHDYATQKSEITTWFTNRSTGMGSLIDGLVSGEAITVNVDPISVTKFTPVSLTATTASGSAVTWTELTGTGSYIESPDNHTVITLPVSDNSIILKPAASGAITVTTTDETCGAGEVSKVVNITVNAEEETCDD